MAGYGTDKDRCRRRGGQHHQGRPPVFCGPRAAGAVRVEKRHGLNFELIRDFAGIGYDLYRLLPGLNLLVPFDPDSSPDPYLLNFFCCSADCADRLAARGMLLRSADVRSMVKLDWRERESERDRVEVSLATCISAPSVRCAAHIGMANYGGSGRKCRRTTSVVILCSQPGRRTADAGPLSRPRSEFLAIENVVRESTFVSSTREFGARG